MLEKYSKFIFIGSLVLLIVAIVMASWGFDKVTFDQIQKNVQLENNSMTYKKFVKSSKPMDFKVYIFNVINPDEVNNGEKPILNEVGPYVYKEYHERRIIGYGENDTIKYMLKKRFEFDPEASTYLTEDDEVTVVHISYLASLLAVHEMIPNLTTLINGALAQFFPNLTDGFLRIKVRDLLFEGIYLNCEGDNPVLALVCGRLNSERPPTMRKAETNGYYFSMFSQMNNTESGPYEMKRGRDDVHELGHLVSYQDSNIMRMWDDQYCGMINGSDATIFPPIDADNIPEKIYSFETLICRSLYVDYVGPRNMFNMSTYYYEISESLFASKSANKNNDCFCKKNWSANRDGCLVMGVLNLMPCQGAPAIVSLPHFYLGSEELLAFFQEGVKPDKEKHNTHVYIDPVTGVALKGVKRLQFNVEMRQMRTIPQLKSVPTGLFPVLWIEEGGEIPQSILDELHTSRKYLGYLQFTKWLLLVIAIIVTIVSAALVARYKSLSSWPLLRSSSTNVNKPV